MYAKRCCTDASFLTVVFDSAHYDVSAEMRRTTVEADITETDLIAIIYGGHAEPIDMAEVKGCIRVFTACEKPTVASKGRPTRRRLITAPDWLNATLMFPGEVSLPGIAALQEDTFLPFVRTGDIETYFPSFAIPCAARNFFCFRYAQSWYRLCVIATGQRQCPCFAQILSEAVLLEAVYRAKPTDTIATRAYIDNFRISTKTANDVATSWAATHEVLYELGASMIDEATVDGDGRPYDFLGVTFYHMNTSADIAPRTVATQKMRDKTRMCAENVLQRTTLRQFLGLLGMLQFISLIQYVERHRYYPVYKFLRRRVAACAKGKFRLDDEIGIWPSLLDNLRHFVHVCTTEITPLLVLQPSMADRDNQMVAFSDASLEGWAMIAFFRTVGTGIEKMLIAYGAWSVTDPTSAEHIQHLEALAVINGLNTVRDDILSLANPTGLLLFIDNTSVTYALTRGTTRNFWLNQLAQRIVECLHDLGIVHISVSWIGSLQNLADAFTRQQRSVGVHNLLASLHSDDAFPQSTSGCGL